MSVVMATGVQGHTELTIECNQMEMSYLETMFQPAHLSSSRYRRAKHTIFYKK